MIQIEKYSIGIGDRFAHQAKAQLQACILAAKAGVDVIPVWNKSNREHMIIGSEPSSVRAAADAAVQALSWKRPYHVDADHITLQTVNRFIAPSDFFTIDVAAFIGKPADPDVVNHFVIRHPELDSGARASPENILPRFKKPGAFIAASRRLKERGTSSPKSPWTRPIRRKRRRS